MDAGTITIIGFLATGPIGAAVVARYLPPKSTPLERLTQLEVEMEELRNEFRRLQNYTHELRDDVVNVYGGTPRPWPEGLMQ